MPSLHKWAHGRKLPGPTQVSAVFWEGLADGRLLVQVCGECSFPQHPPGLRCRRCASSALGFEELDPVGQVVSWTKNHQPWFDGQEVPFIIVAVRIDVSEVLLFGGYVDPLIEDPLDESLVGRKVLGRPTENLAGSSVMVFYPSGEAS